MLVTYDTLPDTTRVWIYQSSRAFTEEELPRLEQQLQTFVQRWVSHNRQLRAFAGVFHQRFIVLMVDESLAGASGCSIDASVHFIKQLEQAYNISLFDRMTFAYKDGDAVITAPREEFARLYAEGKISDETLVFDNLVDTKGAFDKAWVKPLGESWHKRMV